MELCIAEYMINYVYIHIFIHIHTYYVYMYIYIYMWVYVYIYVQDLTPPPKFHVHPLPSWASPVGGPSPAGFNYVDICVQRV